MFLGSQKARNLGGNLCLDVASQEIIYHSASINIIFIQVSQLRELIEVKEVITSYGRSGS